MLTIKKEDWLVNEVEDGNAYFKTKIHDLNDVRVFDLSYAIESAKNRISYDRHKFQVIDYGVVQSYECSEGNAFYILASPIQ